jgi:transglutaminase-like putative cysteine protease
MARLLRFRSGWEKARYLDGAARFDTLNPWVRAVARRLRGRTPGETAENIHRFIRDRVRYVRDPIGASGRHEEEFADTQTVLQRGFDDCDGKARAFVALALCNGLEARIRPVFPRPGSFEHVQAEVRWPSSAWDRRAGRDGWIMSELTLAGVELGQGAESGRRDAAGHLVTS